MAKWSAAKWLIWQNDYGELAYGKLENGETTYYQFEYVVYHQGLENCPKLFLLHLEVS